MELCILPVGVNHPILGFFACLDLSVKKLAFMGVYNLFKEAQICFQLSIEISSILVPGLQVGVGKLSINLLHIGKDSQFFPENAMNR